MCLFPKTADAINVSAVYASACQREIGVIVDVDESRIRLLTLTGRIEEIDRFNIVYIADYPVGDVPIDRVNNAETLPLIHVKTLYQNEVVDLVTGWMIDHSEDRISFLTLKGTETVIDVDDIWDIDLTTVSGTIDFPRPRTGRYHFVHPYPFMHCNDKAEAADKSRLIYPQHLLEDPILIKKELDRLKEGYDRIRAFDNDKVFYARPQVYGNETVLGVWVNLGSRYGASKQRNNNLIPEIISEYSSGPFGFQHRLVTGNALLPSGVHEEPQMHAFYRMKADYVHFAIMVDVNRYVIGEDKYEWHSEDMKDIDHRENDTLNVAGGFDYGPFAVDISVWNRIQYGVRVEDRFHRGSFHLNKGGFLFQNRFINLEAYYGFGSEQKQDPVPLPDDAASPMAAYIEAYNQELANKPEFLTEYSLFRLNLDFLSLAVFRPSYSFILRQIDLKREPDGAGQGEFEYRGLTLTNALTLQYPLNDEIRLAGYGSLEMLESQYGITGLEEKESRLFPKLGLNIGLVF